MTIQELFDTVAKQKPHAYENAELLTWLNRIETRIYDEIIKPHIQKNNTMIYDGKMTEPFALIPFEGFESTTPLSTELIAQVPYDELYDFYLKMQIDLNNQEYEKYNNSSFLFHTAYRDYANYINRTFLPRQVTASFVPIGNVGYTNPLDQ